MNKQITMLVPSRFSYLPKTLGALLLMSIPALLKAEAVDIAHTHGAEIALQQSNGMKVTGKVVDAKTGEAIIGATVRVRGVRGGAVTDHNGQFTLTAPANSQIEIRFAGYKTISRQAGKDLQIKLEEDSEQLRDVVVVGYGTQKKVNLTGSVGSVDGKTLATRPSTNLSTTLQGIIPGVTIISRPGGSVSLNIRGRGNLGFSEPLYIVDGVEVTSGFFNSLSPNDIEKISFLKDAASAAIYGAKAAFGVVLVTTKTAREGQLQISYDGSFGAQSPTYLPELVSSGKYAELYSLAETNSGVKKENLTFSPEMIQKYYDGSDPDRYPNTNWFDVIVRKQSLFTKHNLQFVGGSKQFKYVLGAGFMHNQSLYPGQHTNRVNLTTRTVADLKPWFRISSSINYIYSGFEQKGGVGIADLSRLPPTQTVRQSNGAWGSVRNGRTTTPGEANQNLLRIIEESGRGNTQNNQFLGTLSAELKPLEGLKITNQFGYSYRDYKVFRFRNKMKGVPNFLNPAAGIINGTASMENQMNQNWMATRRWVYDGWANYNKTFGGKHELGAMLGVHADSDVDKVLGVGRKDFASNDMNDLSGGSTDPNKQTPTTGTLSEEVTNSYFGRINYTYDNKYLFEANLRADASSRFAKKGRWGYFPSFSLGWRLDQEQFMRSLSWVDALKLRVSWGRNGNIRNIGLYDGYTAYETTGNIPLNNQLYPTIKEELVGNPDLTWETTTTSNLGLELSIYDGLFRLDADVYNRITSGILVKAPGIMTETGLSGDQIPSHNIGRVRNRGLELSLSHANSIGDFSYDLGVNMTYNRNKILDLGDGVDQLPSSSIWVMRKGGSIGDLYMFEANGIYSTEDIRAGRAVPYGGITPEAGMVRYVDQLTEDTNGDGIPDAGNGVIGDEDRTIVGSDVPRFTYGTSLNLSYQNFSLSIMGQGVTGIKVYLSEDASTAFYDNSVPRNWQLNNWTETNQTDNYPKLFAPSDLRFRYNLRTSSYWLFSAAYFRIKNITLGYTLPQSITSKLGLTGGRIYVSGENLFTLRGDKRMKDFDPEVASGRGYTLGIKTITAGLSITF